MDETRIAGLLYPGLGRAAARAEPPWQRIDEIRVLLRRHLPAVTASLFARTRTIAAWPEQLRAPLDWYSDLPGHPRAFDGLADAEQVRILALVEDRLRSIRQLADELESGPSCAPGAGSLLRQAARYPHPHCIYLVGAEPVLTYWGLDLGLHGRSKRGLNRALGGPRRNAGPRSADDAAAPLPRRMRLVPTVILILLLGGLAFGLWQWRQAGLRDELQADLEAGLAAQCEPTALLEALYARLEEIDPAGKRFLTLRLDAERGLNRCADAADLAARLALARVDCSQLPALADALLYHDTSGPPFAALQAGLDASMAKCRLADDLHGALSAAVGDCGTIARLADDNATLAREGYPVGGPAMEIAVEAAACRVAAQMRQRLAEAEGDCWAVREVDRDLGQRIAGTPAGNPEQQNRARADDRNRHRDARVWSAALDLSRSPLAELRADLDRALHRCALADHLVARLAAAQQDCVALFALRNSLSRQDRDAPPFDEIARQIDASVAQCSALNDLEARFVRVQGDCDRLAAFGGELDPWRDNLRFANIRARVAEEGGICRQADVFMRRIADLGMDCAGLHALADVLAKRPGSQFDRPRTVLEAKLLHCRTLARLDRRLANAGSHCGQLKALRHDLKQQSSAFLGPFRERLAKALLPCRPEPKPTLSKASAAEPLRSGHAPAGLPRGSGAFALRGQCSGSLVISPDGGYHGDRVRHVVRIAPPANARIARVVSDNRGCRNCRLTKRNATTWSVGLFYGCSGRGTVPIAYSAYDGDGRLVCSGRGAARCLGRRR